MLKMARRRKHVKIENEIKMKKIKTETPVQRYNGVYLFSSLAHMIDIDSCSQQHQNTTNSLLSVYFKPEPTEWSTIYDNIRTMRATGDAPVDTMGCEECYAACATDKERRFQVIYRCTLHQLILFNLSLPTYSLDTRVTSNELADK